MLLSEGQMSDYKGAALMIDALPGADWNISKGIRLIYRHPTVDRKDLPRYPGSLVRRQVKSRISDIFGITRTQHVARQHGLYFRNIFNYLSHTFSSRCARRKRIYPYVILGVLDGH